MLKTTARLPLRWSARVLKYFVAVLNTLYPVLWYGVRQRAPVLSTIDPPADCTVSLSHAQRITLPQHSYETAIFQPWLNLWRFIVVFPTAFCREPGKEIDHHVRANAKSDFGNLT
jgi:hypothetical protein